MRFVTTLLLLAALTTCTFSNFLSEHKTTINKELINVHLICHSHDDVGWLKTVDEYFYGARNDIQRVGVQFILDSVVEELLKDSTRHFVYVESAFFWRWWREQDKEQKEKVRWLVKQGQLEFINGGWSMNDEATTYYEDIIDQMTLGHSFLYHEFGVKPHIGWHIDPFGHSNAQAQIFNQMGFDSFFFARIDYQDFQKRKENRTLEMIWSPKQDSGEDASIFTHVNYNHYSEPTGFCFDASCNDEPIMDDPKLDNYNVDRRAKQFADYFINESLHYQHSKEIMHTMGSDFTFMNARQNFKNLDKLMKYVNSHPELGIHVEYSTPSKYMKRVAEVSKKENITYPKKTDDFFPYAMEPQGYWTGFFTSRPSLKAVVKESSRYLQKVRTLFGLLEWNNESKFLTENQNEKTDAIFQLEESMAINQHHDAVAGTAKQAVSDNYIEHLAKGVQGLDKVYGKVLNERSSKVIDETVTTYEQCVYNETASRCNTTQALLKGSTVLMTIYNPTGQRDSVLRVKVPTGNFKVVDHNNEVVKEADVFCVNQNDPQDCDLYIKATHQNYSYNYYKLVPTATSSIVVPVAKAMEPSADGPAHYVEVSDSKSLVIQSNLEDFSVWPCNKNTPESECVGDTQDFKLSYNYYKSYQGKGVVSGTYLFRPDNETFYGSIPYNNITKSKVYIGRTQTIVLVEGDKVDYQVKISTEADNKKIASQVIEIESFVKGIDVSDQQGKEVTMNIKTGINNNGTFYTDSNGLELQKRTLNYRATWDLEMLQPVSGNYYPINVMIGIEDVATKSQAFVLTDRSQGGSSYKNGEIEIMIHRRLLLDDDKGLVEVLDEKDTDGKGLKQRYRHYLLFTNPTKGTNQHRRLQLLNDLEPLVHVAVSETTSFKRTPTSKELQIPTSFVVPDMAKAFVEANGNGNFLVRFHNLNEVDRITVEVPKMKYEEVTLNGIEPKAEMEKRRNQWWNQDKKKSNETITEGRVNLKPMEIKTFLFQESNNQNNNKQVIQSEPKESKLRGAQADVKAIHTVATVPACPKANFAAIWKSSIGI